MDALDQKLNDIFSGKVVEEKHAATFHFKEYKSLPYMMRRSFTSDFDF